ncbi:MAG: TRAP transporter large permease, partial [Marivivens sp.]|nr:TRAP transporter large permease [Marivivens sp.]
MSNLEIGLWSFPALLGLIFLRVPIGISMFCAGFGGLWLMMGNPNLALAKLKTETFTTFSDYSMSIVPMFLLMGHFASIGGMSRALFKAAESWIGHRRGGVAMAAVGACAGFGAICGSSLATAATMSKVALPELKRAGYAGGFSTATLAAGGTLGILIPPSLILVVYAILTEQNIAKLFLAAFIPGLLAAVGYAITISLYVRRYPDQAGTRPPVPYADRMRELIKVWPVLAVFATVVGGIYTGLFTPTQGAAVGAAGTGIVAALNGTLGRSAIVEAFLATAKSSAMIYLIVFGAKYYNGFLARSGAPQEVSEWLLSQGYAPIVILIAILVFYLIMGCVMDSLSMILLTVPIFFPALKMMEWGMTTEELAIWFGVLVLIVVEVGLITPPVGMNLFIINSMDRETPMPETYRAVIWFVGSDLIRVAMDVTTFDEFNNGVVLGDGTVVSTTTLANGTYDVVSWGGSGA